jgi:multidrug efflux system outer membrane protein
VEAAVDEAHAARAERSAAALLLAGSVADAYFGWQADQGRIALARERLDAVRREGAIAQERVRAEIDPPDTRNGADAAAAAAREAITALEGSAKLRVVTLAALVGRPAAELPALQPRPLPPLSGALPDDVRLDLLARRADITASRWRVEAAEKNLAVARAEFFPDVSINALLGLQSNDIGRLLEYGSRVPQIGGAVHLPVFDRGRLQGNYGANQALVESAVDAYRETVVDAAREVATQALTRAQLTQQRSERALQVEAAQQHRATAAARVREGVADARTELTATESWLEQRDALLQIDAAALSADIGLQRSLGGGYQGADNIESTKATP